jgi:hypothetical protein
MLLNLRRNLIRARKPTWVGIAAGLVLSFGFCFLGVHWWNWRLGNVPIRFYGRITGTDGRGVAGAVVTARVTVIPFLSIPDQPWQRLKEVELVATTESDGRFMFRSRGTLIHITRVSAPGLALWNAGGGMEKGFRYSHRHRVPTTVPSDPERPYVYRMVPANSPEAKWKADRRYEPDG